MTETVAQDNLPLPPPPRPVTPRVARRAWFESPVHGWWKSAIVVTVVMLLVTAVQVRDYLRERDLLARGLPVTAKIIKLDDRTLEQPGYRPARDTDHYVKLLGNYPDGRKFEVEGTLPKAEGFAALGGMLQLRVDPNNPNRWVEVKEKQEPLWRELMAFFLLAPVVLLLLAMALWRRANVLKVWKNGTLRDGVIVECKHSATAPLARGCRYIIADGADRRVFHMLYPTRYGIPRKGDVLPLLVLPDQPQHALAAYLYATDGQ